MFGLPDKGVIAPGADADILVWDPNGKTKIGINDKHHMNMDYSAYEGFEIDGKVDTVISRGTVIIENDNYIGTQGPRQVHQARPVHLSARDTVVHRGLTPDEQALTRGEAHESHFSTGSTARSSSPTSGRSAVVYNPATGEQSGAVDLASVDEVDAAVAAAKAAFPEWRATSLSRRAEVMFRLRELVDANRKEIASLLTAEHGKVLTDAMGEVARGLENIEFACGIPQLIKGELLRAGRERHRRVLDPPAARRRRRHHAVQLPGDGPDVDVRQRPGLRQHVRAQAEREGSVGRRCSSPSCSPRPACPPGASTSCRATRSPSTGMLEHPDIAAVSFVGSTPIAKYIYETGTRQRQAGAGARRRQEPHARAAPTPTSTWPPTPRSAPATARPASAAWRSASCSPRRASPTSWSPRSPSASRR